MRTLRAQRVQVVGIDQVFVTTTARFYARLAEQVKNPPARAYLRERAAVYEARGRAFERAGGEKSNMGEQRPSTVDSLVALTRQESPAVRQMVQDYAASYAIYRAYDFPAALPNGLSSHQARVNLMRRNLLRYLGPRATAAQPLPKMLFKFGTNHAGRGVSPASFGEFYDVGNLAQALAEAQGQKSLHLMVVGKQGTEANGSNQLDRRKNVSSYTAADRASVKPFLDQTTGPAWNVVDLRPARRALTAGKLATSQTMQRLLLGYDYLVVIPETTASRTY